MPYIGLLVVILGALVFFDGYVYTKLKTLEGSAGSAPQAAAQQQPAQAAQQPAQPQISMDTIKGLFGKNVIKFGKGDKKLLMVEVSDPSCPYCHVASGSNTTIGAQMGPRFTLTSQGGTYTAPVPEMKKLVESGKADFVWIYSPGHGNGELGTKAMYCAFDQGKFWQAEELLMSAKGYDLLNTQVKNDKTKSGDVASFLASVLDSGKLKSCIDSGKYDTRLTEDTALATALGVNGTPGFYLNTTNFAGAYSWTDMKTVADAALK